MNLKTLKNQSLCALAISLALYTGSALAKDFTEDQFASQTLGHGVYELAYDAGQQAIYAASAPSFDKDKTAGEVFLFSTESSKVDERIATERRPFAVSLDEPNHILWFPRQTLSLRSITLPATKCMLPIAMPVRLALSMPTLTA